MNVLIITGGDNCIFNFSSDFFKSFDFIVACDKGYDYARQIDLKPNLVIGDFDSCQTFKELNTHSENFTKIIDGITFMKFPKEKDDTDTMLAVKIILEKYCKENPIDEIHIICAFGNRLDHTFSNIQTGNFIADNGKIALIYGRKDEICVIKDSKIILPQKSGYSLSVFSLSDKSEGVCIKGTKYCVENAVFENKFPLGQSNEWVAGNPSAEISVKKGTLLIVMSKLEE